MSTSKQVAKTVISLHGVNALREILNQRPTDARYIAISKDKCASIFYKNELGVLKADYRNGQGWEKAQQVSVGNLEKDLQVISFLLCELDDLSAELSKHPVEGEHQENPLTVLKGLVNTQIVRVDLRRQASADPTGYWAGSQEAYETVLHMVRTIEELKEGCDGKHDVARQIGNC